MTVRDFTAADVPDQTGRTHLVTGANTGLGYETANVLAARGARVLMGCRNRDKAEAARGRILATALNADVAIVELDLADLASVRAVAERVREEDRLDALINNAGLMMPPRGETTDGFERQFGVNHLGTFALTGLLIDKLRETPRSRVVTTASNAHRSGRIDLDDPNATTSYSRWGRYAMSKLANLLHALELDRRLRVADPSPDRTIAVSCHPGGADTELGRFMPGPLKLALPLMRPFLNTAAMGAWPQLAAATAPGVEGGDYLGPSGRGEWKGPARTVEPTERAKDVELARQLWALSEEMTGVRYDLVPVPERA